MVSHILFVLTNTTCSVDVGNNTADRAGNSDAVRRGTGYWLLTYLAVNAMLKVVKSS
jgi:hypothetical protein